MNAKYWNFKKLLETTHNGWWRDLAYHQQQSGSQIFKCLFTICQIYRFQQTAIDYTKTFMCTYWVYTRSVNKVMRLAAYRTI